MSLEITRPERDYLRDLAKKQREYAASPVMEERRRRWLSINAGSPVAAPIVVETWTFTGDMMPEGVLRCRTAEARRIESVLLGNLREHEILDDDKVMPDFFPVRYAVSQDDFGLEIETKHVADSSGRRIGHEFIHPIDDLEEDFGKLQPLSISVDREATIRECDLVDSILGGILPVALNGCPGYIGLTEKVIKLMGMEQFYYAMMDQPDAVHRLMRHLTDGQLEVLRFHEREGLLTLNNGNHQTGMSSYGFTNELPSAGFDGHHVRTKDIWLWVEAEEMAGASPELFKEFVLPYVAEVSAELGLVYYGCCEPLHFQWPDIYAAIPNIRKVSVSPWSDPFRMGEHLRGTGVVFSRKPSAVYLGVNDKLDEAAWRAHIRETAEAAKGCPLEIIIRDVYKVRNLLDVRRAVEIAREETSR